MCLFLQMILMRAERSGAFGDPSCLRRADRDARVGESHFPSRHREGCGNMFWTESAGELVDVLSLNAPPLELLLSGLSPASSSLSLRALTPPSSDHNWKEQKETSGFIFTHPGVPRTPTHHPSITTSSQREAFSFPTGPSAKPGRVHRPAFCRQRSQWRLKSTVGIWGPRLP